MGGAQREVVSFSLSKLFMMVIHPSLSIHASEYYDLCMQSSTSILTTVSPASDFNNRVYKINLTTDANYFFGADKPTTFNLFPGKSGLQNLTFDTYSSPGRYKTSFWRKEELMMTVLIYYIFQVVWMI